MLEEISRISRREFRVISWMQWVRFRKKDCRRRERSTCLFAIGRWNNGCIYKRTIHYLSKIRQEWKHKRTLFLLFEKLPIWPVSGLQIKLLATLSTAGIPVRYVVDQGYDGAAAMSDCTNGVQKHFRDKYSTAMYVHCISHCLNLCLRRPGNRDQKSSHTNEGNCRYLSRFQAIELEIC